MVQDRLDAANGMADGDAAPARTRRDLLRLGVAGAVGAGAASAAVLGFTSSPVGAAAGDNILIDETTTGGGGTTILQSTTLRAPLQDNGGQVFNVKAFGAVGNGIANDTAAIAAAQSAAGAGCVYFPPGTYMVTGLTVNTAGQSLKLEAGAIVQLVAGLGTPTPVVLITSANVAILGPGTIDGNSAAQTSANGFDGVKFANGADDGIIEAVTVQNAAWIGIRADGANRVRIALNRVLNNTHSGISSSSLSSSMEGPLILGNTVISSSTTASSGVNVQGGSSIVLVISPRVIGNQVEATSGIGVQISNCQYAKVSDNLAAGPAQAFSVVGGTDNVVSGNTALPSGGGAGIEFGSNNSICANNTVNHSGTGAGITADNISGTHVVISNNKVTGAQTQGIRVGSYDHVSVTGNVIQQFALTTPSVHGVIEVSPTGAGTVLIGNNVCDGANGFDYGIWLIGLISSAAQVSVHDNGVTGTAIAALRLSGTGSVTDIVVHDNTLAQGIALYSLDAGLTLGANVRFHDNIVVGAGNSGLVGTVLPASGSPYTNSTPFTEVIYLQGGVLSGSGTTNGVVKNGHVLVDSSLKMTFPMAITLQPGESITVYYVTAPNIWKDVKS